MGLRSPADDLTAISLCTGGGALDLALELAIPALRPILYVEREAFACATLVQAMEAAYLAAAPLWSDARTVPGRRFRGCVDLVFGGIPCQPHSEAGPARGADDDRDLWAAARRVVVQSGAWAVFIENVGGMLHTGGAERVHRELRRLGFKVAGGLFTASEVGASHERERLFILAVNDALADAHDAGRAQRLRLARDASEERPTPERDGGTMGDPEGEPSRTRLRQARAVVNGRGAGGAGEPLGDPASLQRRQGRPGAGVRPGRRDAASSAGEPMGDAYGGGYRGGSGEPVGGSQRRASDPWTGPSAAFPPGPDDLAGWRDTLAIWPHLEPVVRRNPDGLAARAERARHWPSHARALRMDRLRLLGGGVVPLEAAFAFRTLASELARTSTGAAGLVRMSG